MREAGSTVSEPHGVGPGFQGRRLAKNRLMLYLEGLVWEAMLEAKSQSQENALQTPSPQSSSKAALPSRHFSIWEQQSPSRAFLPYTWLLPLPRQPAHVCRASLPPVSPEVRRWLVLADVRKESAKIPSKVSVTNSVLS